ncbi:hypothetical protein PHYPSEUDO_013872 [Phytophthora pseudosyringae]|uniref:Uncharacterized protein n=1 Tax=Phytophthora pseudosyringae TaxID=221518 RepID=A0A8T1W192_9STRA|nr:hypothetical protein PHYPSEUDO_013872 [Phytophthora pseudosyringae]
MGQTSSNGRTLPRKLATSPFAASLLLPSLSLDEALQRRQQLQRIAGIAVIDATRDKTKNIVITLKLSLVPTTLREQVGIFIPSNAPVTHETTMTFRDVNQLNKVLAFCIDKMAGKCRENCEFCSQLRTYLDNHWVKDPIVSVTSMGNTLLRKASLAVHLAYLVEFATRKHIATPRVSKQKGVATVQLVPLSSHEREKTRGVDVCAAQKETTVVLYNFFDVFTRKSAPAPNSSPIDRVVQELITHPSLSLAILRMQ